jgi:hypothetical protein
MDEGPPGAGSLVVPAARVRVSGEAVRVGPPRPADVPEPKIRVFHDHDVVQMIEVVCTCGERIRIRCEYT